MRIGEFLKLATIAGLLGSNSGGASAGTQVDLSKSVAPGGDLTTALQAFANSALLTSCVLNVPGTYTIGQVSFTNGVDKQITIGPNVVIQVSSTAQSMVIVNPGNQWITTAATASTTVDISEDGAQTTNITQVTLGAAQTVKRGQYLRLMSDDLYPTSTPGDGTNERRLAEVVVAGMDSAASTTLNLSAVARDQGNYTTSPRIAAYSTMKFKWSGGIFTSTDTTSTNVDGYAFLDIRGCVNPQVQNVRIEKGATGPIRMMGIYTKGCVNPLVEDCFFLGLANIPSTGIYGYAMAEGGSEGGIYRRLVGVTCRHVFTTVTYWLPTQGNWWAGGKTRSCVVSDSVGHASAAASFDTHGEADGVTFVNCHSHGSYNGNSGGGGGFSCRGAQVTFIGCTSHGDRNGIQIVTYDHAKVINCTFRSYFQACGVSPSVEKTSFGNRRTIFRGCHFECDNIASVVTSLLGTSTQSIEADFEDCRWIFTGATNNFGPIQMTYATVRYKRCVFDMSDFTGTSAIPFYFSTTATGAGTCTVDIDGLRIVGATTPGYATYNMWSVANADTNSVRMKNVEYYGSVGISGATTQGNKFGIPTNASAAIVQGFTNVAGTVSTTSYSTGTAAAAYVCKWSCDGDQEVTYVLGGSAGAVSLTNLVGTNRRAGDRIRISNGSNGVVTVNSVAIAVNASQLFVFNGSATIQAM